MKRIRISERRWGEVSDEEYQQAVQRIVLWIERGMDPEDSAELAAHQLRLLACTKNRTKTEE